MHRPRRSSWTAALLSACLACGEEAEPTPPGPTVSYVLVQPADTLLVPGDTLRLHAAAFDAADAEIPGLELSWRSRSPSVADVDDGGLLTALAPGEARIEAATPGGARGLAAVRVRIVGGFTPDHGAFGEVVTLTGVDLDRATAVRFGPFDAFVRSVAADGRSLEAWVPVYARTGPIRVTVDGQERETERPFYVTGLGDDALEPNGYSQPLALPFPFENPSLVTRPPFSDPDVDLYRIRVDAPGPFRAALIERSPLRSRFRAVRMELLDAEAEDLVGIVASWSSIEDEALDTVAIALSSLPAGTYDLLVTPYGFTGFSALVPGDRSYGLALDTRPSWVLAPDSTEPDDYPPLAPRLPYPFQGRFRIENPYGSDYFRFRVDQPTDVWVLTAPAEREHHVEEDVDLFLMSMPTKAVQYVVATGQFPAVYHASIAPESSEQIYVRIPAGEYVVGVLDLVGKPATYDVWIGADSGEETDDAPPLPFRRPSGAPAAAARAGPTLEALRAAGKLWPAPRP